MKRNADAVLILILSIITLAICLPGCGEAMTTQERVQVFKDVSTFMRENRMTGNANLNYRGIGEVWAATKFGADVGLQFWASAQFNATEGPKTDPQAKPPTPPMTPGEGMTPAAPTTDRVQANVAASVR